MPVSNTFFHSSILGKQKCGMGIERERERRILKYAIWWQNDFRGGCWMCVYFFCYESYVWLTLSMSFMRTFEYLQPPLRWQTSRTIETFNWIPEITGAQWFWLFEILLSLFLLPLTRFASFISKLIIFGWMPFFIHLFLVSS